MQAERAVGAGHGGALVGRQHAVQARGPQGLEIFRRPVPLDAFGAGQPGAVGVHLVQGVGCDLRPCSLRILGDVHEERPRRRGRRTRLAAQLAARLLVDGPQRIVHGDEAIAESGGPARRRLRGSAHEQDRPAPTSRLRGDAHLAAVVLEDLPRPRRPQGRHAVLEQRHPLAHLPPEHGQLLGPVAGADDEVDPPPTGQVEHGKVLGQADRVIEREQQGGDQDAERSRPAGDGRGHDEGRRAVPVVGAMVLRQADEPEAALLRPRALLEGSAIQRLWRRTELRRAQVVAQRELHLGLVHGVVPTPGSRWTRPARPLTTCPRRRPARTPAASRRHPPAGNPSRGRWRASIWPG